MSKNCLLVVLVLVVVPVARGAVVSMPLDAGGAIGYENQLPFRSALGWGHNSGVIPKQTTLYGGTYFDQQAEQVRWWVEVSVLGSYFPADRIVTPEMEAYRQIGPLEYSLSLVEDSVTYQNGNEWWQAEFNPGLSVRLNLTNRVGRHVLDWEGNRYEIWYGSSWANLRVENGAITQAHRTFVRTEYNDRPATWESFLYFSGVAMPGEMAISMIAIPEPATAVFILVGLPFLRRRQCR